MAIVTGGHKGLGYATVKELSGKFNGDVILTCNSSDGQRAVEVMQKQLRLKNQPKFHQLDLADHTSGVQLKDRVLDTYGALDVLINNHSFTYHAKSEVPFLKQATETIK